MILFGPGRYFIGFWHLEVPDTFHKPCGGNLLHTFFREGERPLWTGQFRHRYYDGHGGTLKESWYGIAHNGQEVPEQEMIDRTNAYFDTLEKVTGKKVSFFEIKGDVEKFFALAKTGQIPKWLNIQMVETHHEPK